MLGATLPLGGHTALLTICFGLSALGASVGNAMLAMILNYKGMRISFFSSGWLFYPSVLYFKNRERVGSWPLDLLALAVILSPLLAIVSGILLFPQFFSARP